MTNEQFNIFAAFVTVGFAIAILLAVFTFPEERPAAPTNTIVRDCELAGVHVVDNDTAIVCRVMKRDPTPEVETKPEDYL